MPIFDELAGAGNRSGDINRATVLVIEIRRTPFFASFRTQNSNWN
jgi:hypothetical protein